jgi:ribonucleoside-diphosphate reductase alpha chain
VAAGTIKSRLAHPGLKHNVSNTINVMPEEWDEVTKFIFDNRKYFAGVSLLPVSGDKDYIQAPFCAVYTPSKMVEHYGDASMFCSGLIEEALSAFDNLWIACDAAMGLCNDLTDVKREWIKRLEKFAVKYFEGDIKKTTYLLKDVFNWKLWLDLSKSYKDVDYTEMNVEKQTNFEAETACAGGKCELV